MILRSKGYKRAGARGVLALLVCSLALGGCATAGPRVSGDRQFVSGLNPRAYHTVFLAREARPRKSQPLGCQWGEDCGPGIYEYEFQAFHWIAGNPNVQRLGLAEISSGGRRRNNLTYLVFAERWHNGDWTVVDIDAFEPDACVRKLQDSVNVDVEYSGPIPDKRYAQARFEICLSGEDLSNLE